MSIYTGIRHGSDPVIVTVDGEPLDPRIDLWNHSCGEFNWGYGGSGPAQLALALAAHVLRDDQRAVDVHQAFKRAVIGKLPDGGWLLTDYEIKQTIEALEVENEMAKERAR